MIRSRLSRFSSKTRVLNLTLFIKHLSRNLASSDRCYANLPVLAALCYQTRSLTKIFSYSLCSGESFWLVFLISDAEKEYDFGFFSLRGEATKPSCLTRGLLSLDENPYSNKVCFVCLFLFSFWYLLCLK